MASQISWQIKQAVADLQAGSLAAQVVLSGGTIEVSRSAVADDATWKLAPLAIRFSDEGSATEMAGRVGDDFADETALELGDPIECYCRATDLVATYAEPGAPQGTSPRVGWQVYWRGLAAGPAAGIELMLSMQTNHLHSDLAMTTRSIVPNVESWKLAEGESGAWQPIDHKNATQELSPNQDRGVLLCRLPDSWASGNAAEESSVSQADGAQTGQWSYVEMISPADYLGGHLQQGATSSRRGASGIADSNGDVSTLQFGYRLFAEHLERGVLRRARLQGWLVPRADDFARAEELYRAFCESQLPLAT